MALKITSSDGQQNTTGNPQTAPTGTPGTPAKSGSVQPGTSTDLLNSQQGIGLGSPALTTVNLDSDPSQVRTQTGSQSQAAAQPPYHANLAWLSVPAIFLLVAAGMVWAIARSAKSTTN
ncbi:MAG TPA: hypothetical protein VFX84_00405 [Candidatus Saccharimonadales bacterium]|nr:hypothetical protein [Candidatus Saccharimonadales bacterium]